MTEADTKQVPLGVKPVPAPFVMVNRQLVIYEREGRRVAVHAGEVFHTWLVGDLVAENFFVVQARVCRHATIIELAAALNRPQRTLFHALKRFEEGGAAALLGKPRGRPKGSGVDPLRDPEIRRLRGRGWTLRSIAEQIGCCPLTVIRALERMKLSRNVTPTRRVEPLSFPAAEEEETQGEEVVSLSTGGTEAVVDGCEPTEEEARNADARVDALQEREASSESEAVPEELENAPVEPVAISEPAKAENAPDPKGERVEPLPEPEHEAEEVPERSGDSNPFHREIDRGRAARGELQDAAPLFAPGFALPYAGLLLAVPFLVESGLLEEATRLYRHQRPAFYGIRTTLLVIVLLTLLRVKRPENLKEYDPSALGRIVGLDRVPEVKTLRRKLAQLVEGPMEDLLLALARRRAQRREDALAWLFVGGHVRVYHGKEKLPGTHVTRLRIAMPATQDIWVHDGDLMPVLRVTQEAHPSLASALPPILEAAREVVGERRLTVVFDRGGWSPALFARLVAGGTDILTYRKGATEPVPTAEFQRYPAPAGGPDWLLHDARVTLKNGLVLRQITRLVGDHQTAIVTSRTEEPVVDLAARMFHRWGQENFFKYMRAEFDLDGLVEYGSVDADPRRELPNPEWTRRNRVLQAARARQKDVLARTLDITHPDAVAAAARVEEARLQRNVVPRRVTVGDLAQPTVRLLARKKRLYDALKTLAYQIETSLTQAVAPFYRRSEDEGRTLISTALRSAGQLQVTPRELILTLAPQSCPHRTRALADLCHILDQVPTRFPGSSLRLRYRVEGVPDTRKTAKLSGG